MFSRCPSGDFLKCVFLEMSHINILSGKRNTVELNFHDRFESIINHIWTGPTIIIIKIKFLLALE